MSPITNVSDLNALNKSGEYIVALAESTIDIFENEYLKGYNVYNKTRDKIGEIHIKNDEVIAYKLLNEPEYIDDDGLREVWCKSNIYAIDFETPEIKEFLTQAVKAIEYANK